MLLDWLFLLCVALKQDLVRKHKDALQSCKSHNLALLKSNQQAELEVRHGNPKTSDHYKGIAYRHVLFGWLTGVRFVIRLWKFVCERNKE